MTGLRHFVGVCGTAIEAVALIALSGYWLHHEGWYKWRGEDGMAVNTAVLFSVVGFVFIMISFTKKPWNRL